MSGATCTSFTYSDWGPCTVGQQTRTVALSYPYFCTGGSPVLSQTCNCGTIAGCDTGYSCYSGNTFYTTNNCSGSYSPYSNTCHPSGRTTYACVYMAPSTSQTYIPVSGCTYTKACASSPGNGAGLGCQTGFTCVNSQVSLSSPFCENLLAAEKACIPNAAVNLGCHTTGTTNMSYRHELATGCTYMP